MHLHLLFRFHLGKSFPSFFLLLSTFSLVLPTTPSSLPTLPLTLPYPPFSKATGKPANAHAGSYCLGRDRRDLPPQSTRQIPLHDNCHKLAPKLGDRLLYTLPRKLWPGRRQPAIQDLLHLVRVLLLVHRIRVLHDLRDEGPYPRTSR